ncbi:MAG: hypothetical protein HY534_00880 [Chloroflexi bacterium]|nr:hypothetical protein [Chloroflexota bacterium]
MEFIEPLGAAPDEAFDVVAQRVTELLSNEELLQVAQFGEPSQAARSLVILASNSGSGGQHDKK